MKKTLSLMLVVLGVFTSNFSTLTFAQTRAEGTALTAAQIARLQDEFRAGRYARGDRFTVSAKLGPPTKLTFPQAQPAKKNGLSTGAKIGIGVGIAAVVGIIIAVVASGNDRQEVGQSPCRDPRPPGPCFQ